MLKKPSPLGIVDAILTDRRNPRASKKQSDQQSQSAKTKKVSWDVELRVLSDKTSNILSKPGKVGHQRKEHLVKCVQVCLSNFPPANLQPRENSLSSAQGNKGCKGNFFIVLVLQMQRMREYEEFLYSLQWPFISIFF